MSDDDGFSSDEEINTKNLTKKQIQEIERKRLKNKKKKESKKRTKAASKDDDVMPVDPKDSGAESAAEKSDEPKEAGESVAPLADEDIVVEVDYVGQGLEIDENDPNYKYFNGIFNQFKITTPDESSSPAATQETHPVEKREDNSKAAIAERIRQEEMEDKRREEAQQKPEEQMSRKKMRLARQPSIAKLKESTHRPDVVEWADVTSRDPFLLVALKAHRNTVPVPRHWNAKRKYLAGKRGFERPPFMLPDFIKRTGIQEMREQLWDKEEGQSLKGKMRERARPKLGKIDIDYQKLHDAFFKWQTKPVMTVMGELYFEGKELETQMREKKPGQLSDELRIALGMPIGPNCHKFPPPWLIAMQRYGPPPSYPNLKIQGLSAPIPEGCSFGYHPGGWGKPPVDEYGKPLYGDVFGVETPRDVEAEDESRIDRRFWGEIGSDDSDSEESEEEQDDEEDGEGEGEGGEGGTAAGVQTPMTEGMVTPSGLTSGVPTGVETPDTIELRKGRRADESMTGADTPAQAYQVIPEKRVDRIAGQMMGSTHVYDLSSAAAAKKSGGGGGGEGGVEVSLNPDEELDQRGLEAKYEEQLRKQRNTKDEDAEDFSDMVAEHSAKQNRKRKAVEQKKTSSSSGKDGKEGKKYKDFKF